MALFGSNTKSKLWTFITRFGAILAGIHVLNYLNKKLNPSQGLLIPGIALVGSGLTYARFLDGDAETARAVSVGVAAFSGAKLISNLGSKALDSVEVGEGAAGKAVAEVKDFVEIDGSTQGYSSDLLGNVPMSGGILGQIGAADEEIEMDFEEDTKTLPQPESGGPKAVSIAEKI